MRQFDREYVEKVRGEAAANRTKARDLETQIAERDARLAKLSGFDGYSDEDLEVWNSMSTDWKTDPAVAARRFQQIAVSVLGDPTATAAERADAQAIIDNPQVTQAAEALTPEQVRQIAREEQSAQEQERTSQQNVANIFSQISEAGYAEDSAETISVLWYANNRTGGDIAAAIGLQKAAEQAVVDRYVESMAKGGTPVRLPAAGDAGSPVTEAPKTIADARRQADAWLKERAQA
jgi:predicted Ser/Thr protein kinase